MSWPTSLTEAILISQRRAKERVYQYYIAEPVQSRYRDRTYLTTVEEYRTMTEAAALAAAAGMESDTVDGGGNRTVVTADVQRQNDADAYKIVKTTAYTSEWTAWSAWA